MAVQKPLILISGRPVTLPNGDSIQGALPSGGTTGQTLVKTSNLDGETAWTDFAGIGFNLAMRQGHFHF